MPRSPGLSYVSVTDADLVSRVRRGDLEAYAELMARYRPRLGRYAFCLLGNREDAEEVLQDTFIRAHRALARGDEPERVGAWLFRILVNRCRSRRARREPFDRTPAGTAALEQASVEHPWERESWRDEIRHALQQLPADQREAFLLKHVEELSYEEIAEMTGAGTSALKMRVKRACERLRGLLREVYRV